MRIVAISDTHTLHTGLNVPDGDVLIHAGDLTNHGSLDDVRNFNKFLGTLPHPHKIVIAGNHDFCFQRWREDAEALLTNAIYLEDSGLNIDGVYFYGSPWQPWFYDWAFNLSRGIEIRQKWDLIPEKTDVLITHGPPFGIGDRTLRGEQVGCRELLEVVEHVQPRVHIFGHIHEGYGITHTSHTQFINASTCDIRYKPVNMPLVFDLD